MFLEELRKGRNRDIEGVAAIVLLQARQLSLGLDALGLLESLEPGLGVGVDGIGERAERLLLGIVEEAALLEQERYTTLSGSL